MEFVAKANGSQRKVDCSQSRFVMKTIMKKTIESSQREVTE